MSCSNTVTISQGNTFACTFAWTPGVSGPANLLTTTLTSDFEDRAGTVYPLTVATANDGLSFTVSYPDSTADWTLGLGRWDINLPSLALASPARKSSASTSSTRSPSNRRHA